MTYYLFPYYIIRINYCLSFLLHSVYPHPYCSTVLTRRICHYLFYLHLIIFASPFINSYPVFLSRLKTLRYRNLLKISLMDFGTLL